MILYVKLYIIDTISVRLKNIRYVIGVFISVGKWYNINEWNINISRVMFSKNLIGFMFDSFANAPLSIANT